MTSSRRTAGGFLTFPALVFTGHAAGIANAMSAGAVFPGYLAGAMGFRRELAVFDQGRLIRLAAATLAGGLTGSLLLMVSSNAAFSRIVPGLLLLASLIFLFGDRLRALAARRSKGGTPKLLAVAGLASWGLAQEVELPPLVVGLLFAFLAGGAMLNILKEELPENRQSRFWAFPLGAGGYSALLVLI